MISLTGHCRFLPLLPTQPIDPARLRGRPTLHQLLESLIRIGHRARPRKVTRLQLDDVKGCGPDELVNLPIEVTTAADTLPYRREPALPDDYARIGSAAMLEKDEAPARF